MKKNYIITFLLLISIISLFFNFKSIIYNKDASSKVLTADTNSYYSIIDSLINKFEIKGYNEILSNYNHMLALPLQAKEDDLLNRQKMFVYKCKSKNTVILLNLSISSQENSVEWNSSIDYLPDYFNGINGKFSESYDKNYPNVQLACNSFTNNGISITIIAFSNNAENNVAGEEVISFSNELLKFLEKERN
ncbi:hypothetical protein R2R35_13990 [Anaerocolumna sp. AGMB13020]|uniref:hypothetical protein n=1 Tax=Anaerocolumna sp. AGMB13020 TaxID=3081750 RepID=UPI0029553AE1|nr:hypothetical protein [Anaerocolumna sp. AGMB13020]WOO34909.1 hypothetical protein R2R35_13990 [Anaerocolumna sp. AGMB13020]